MNTDDPGWIDKHGFVFRFAENCDTENQKFWEVE